MFLKVTISGGEAPSAEFYATTVEFLRKHGDYLNTSDARVRRETGELLATARQNPEEFHDWGDGDWILWTNKVH